MPYKEDNRLLNFLCLVTDYLPYMTGNQPASCKENSQPILFLYMAVNRLLGEKYKSRSPSLYGRDQVGRQEIQKPVASLYGSSLVATREI